MGTPKYLVVDRISSINAISSLREGFRIQKNIPGLRRQLSRLLILNYIIFLLVSLLLNGLFYYYVLEPLINWLFGSEGGFFATIGQWMLWLLQLNVAAVFAFISLRFSIEVSGIWHQLLVSRVIRHYREIPEVRFHFRDWMKSLVYSMVEALKLCLVPLLILFAGLIPLIGFLMVYLLESYILGRDVLRVYLDEINEEVELNELRKNFRWVPIKLGWLPMLLAFMPVIGWLLMPLVQILLVIGLASLIERARN